jgi:hypothetical protein
VLALSDAPGNASAKSTAPSRGSWWSLAGLGFEVAILAGAARVHG